MTPYHAIRAYKENTTFKSKDVLVLFGELFTRGYANGLVEEAERRGMTIVRATVGRRDKDGKLRPLNSEEMSNIPKPFINVPLEAGFDLEPSDSGASPIDLLQSVKLNDWESSTLDQALLENSKIRARKRFASQVRQFFSELETHIPNNSNVLIAHLMAGGVPRAKIVLPLMNRSVKGTGDRYLSSEKFWNSQIGQFCSQNFSEVTAETFNILINESTDFRNKIESSGSKVSYTAYGYHGTEILLNGNYSWQTYTPYLQGWAKMRLEQYSLTASQKGIRTCVYNCPEILTNSSSIFNGVEISLYPLMAALIKEGQNSPKVKKVLEICIAKLKSDCGTEGILANVRDCLMSEAIRSHCIFEKWPQHSRKDQLEKLLTASDALISMHKDPKQLITFDLSEVVLSCCGKIMLSDAAQPEAPVSWINHDVIAKTFSS